MLQQTRVDQGLPYYERFVIRFPDIETLADASEDEVLKMWQGLGYYSRARNIHHAAKTIRDKFHSQFPEQYENILSLKGIGEYTAAAVGSFAFDLAHPVLDGNVYRILSRYTGNTAPINKPASRKIFLTTALELFDPEHSAEHNQAIMELGALICTPAEPRCNECPLQGSCDAFHKKNWNELPVKILAQPVKTRHLNYLIITDGNCALMQQRMKKDIWKGLFEFVLIETNQTVADFSSLCENQEFRTITKSFGKNMILTDTSKISHKLTHRILEIYFWVLRVKTLPAKLNLAFPVEIDKINHTFALPKPIENFLVTYNFHEHVS